ncbi:MAG: SDR family oxidoreductase [Planctomycetaceae bacterium]|nr:SDR family oxidoreductase [Planctomycetaceae bacterium]
MSKPKSILVTGAAGRLGLAIVQRLLREGQHVSAVVRRESAELLALQAQFDGRLEILSFDLSDWQAMESWQPLVDPSKVWSGLVNNAAVAYDDLVTNTRANELSAMFGINVFAAIVLSKLVIRNMILHQTAGSLVHVSSISTRDGYKGLAMYAATKGALEAFSKGVAREWGSRGIRSNCIVPGFMETAMSSKLSEEQRAKIYRRNPLGRAVEVESVAATVAFLIGPEANSVTGQDFVVN